MAFGGYTFICGMTGQRVWNDACQVTQCQPSLQNQEKEIVEAALAESKGKDVGPQGASAKLGIPRSTLDSKIKQLKIKKHKFISEQ